MSWKKFGGTNQLNQNSITVNTITTDKISFRGVYEGNFDICGIIHSSGIINTESNLNVLGNAVVHQNVSVFENLDVFGNTITHNNLFATQRIYLGTASDQVDLNGNVSYLYGYGNHVGINNTNPTAILDIHGEVTNLFSVFSDSSLNINTLAQNYSHRGVTIGASDLSSGIFFYSDVSINDANHYDAAILYDGSTNSLYLEIPNDLQLHSGIVVSKRIVNNSLNHIKYEPVTIFDTLTGAYLNSIYPNVGTNTGDSIYLCAQDYSSNTFLKLITPDYKGLAVGGGAYPNDTTRSFGTTGLLNLSGNFVGTQTIVASKNNPYAIPTTLGINTYCPKTDNYCMDVNGPSHYENNSVSSVFTSNFEIKRMKFCKTDPKYGIIIGSPNTLSTPFNHQHYQTNNRGANWTSFTIDTVNTLNSDFLSTSVSLLDAFIFTYSSSVYTFIVGSANVDYIQNPLDKPAVNGFILYSRDSGSTWNPILSTGGLSDVGPLNGISIANINNNSTLAIITSTFGQFYTINISSIFNSSSPAQFFSFVPTSTGNVIPKCVANYTDLSYGFGNLVFVAGYGGFKIYQLFTNSNPLLFGEYLSSPYLIYPANLYGFSGIGNSCLYNKYNYTAISIYDLNHILMIGIDLSWNRNVIARIDSIYNSANWKYIFIDASANDICIYDASSASIACDNGIIYYSIDGYNTWNKTSLDNYNPFKNAGLSYNSNAKITNIFVYDINSFFVTKTITPYKYTITNRNIDISNSKLGQSQLFYCYVPSILNKLNDNVMDVCGNMRISGDLYVNDTGKLKTTNTNMYVFNENVKNIYLGNSATTISIGNPYTNGNTFVQNNLDVSFNITGHKNAYIYGDISVNGTMIANANSVVNGNLYVYNNSITYSDTYVSGNSYVKGNLIVYQGIFFYGGFNIGQETNLMGNLLVTKNTYVSGNSFTNKNITGNANLTIGGNTYIKGNVFILNDLSINGNLFVYGNTVLNNHLQVNADVSMNGTMNFTGDTYIIGNLHVSEATYLGTSLSLSSSLDICGHLNVGDFCNFSGPMNINGPINLNSDVNFLNNVNIPKMLYVGGVGLFNSGLVVNNNVTLNGKVNANDDFNVNSNLNVNKILTVSGQISCSIINTLYDSNKKSYMKSNYIYTGSPANKNIYIGAMGDTIVMNGDVVYNGGYIIKYVGNVQTNSTIMYLNSVSGTTSSIYNGNSAGAGIAIQENQVIDQGFIKISQDLTGYLFKSTAYDNSVPQNVFKMDTARLTVSNNNNADELIILSRPSAYIPTSGQNVPDYSYNMTTSGISTASLFLRNQVLSNGTRQFIDTNVDISGRVNFAGDISINGYFFVTYNANFNGNLIVMYDTSLNGNLKVNGDVSFNSRLCVNGDVSFNGNLILGQTANFNGNVNLYGKNIVYNDISINSTYLDVNANPKFFKKTVFAADVSVNGLFSLNKNATINAGLQVTNGTVINGGVVVGLDVSFNSRARIHGDTNINSRLTVSNDVSFNNNLFLNQNMFVNGGDVSLNNNLCVNKDVSLNSRLFVSQDVSFNTNLFVRNNALINCDLSINGNLYLNGTTIINTDAIINGNLVLTGNSYLFSSILNSENTWLNGNTYVDQLTISGTILAAADFTMNGNIYSNNFVNQFIRGNNVQYGSSTLLNICGGSENIAFGFNNLNNNITGSFNSSFGSNALYSNIADTNSAFGNCALYNNVFGTNNAAFGDYAGLSNTTGSYNTFLGHYSDTTIGTWNNSTAIGCNSMIYGNSMVVLGTPGEIIVPMGDVSFNGNLFVNTSLNVIGSINTLGNINIDGNLNTLNLNATYIGAIGSVYNGNVMINSVNVGEPLYNGNLIVNGWIQQTVGLFDYHNMQYGYGALVSTTNSSFCTNNLAVGYKTLNQLAIGSYNIGLGNSALINLNGGAHNIAMGYYCMQSLIGGGNNIGIGTRVMMSTGSTVNNNVAIGYESLNKLLNGGNNVAYGYQTLNILSNGTDNTSIGYGASSYIYNGIFNVFVGSQAGSNYPSPQYYTNPTNGINYNYNTLLGACTDFYNPSISTIVGYGYSYSTAVGYKAQISASHQIVLGTTTENVYCAGTTDAFNSTTACSLYVAGGTAIAKSLVVGGIVTCSSINSPSDYRIKENISYLDHTFIVDHLQPVSFTNRLTNKSDIGFIAHEVQQNYPELVTGEKDGTEYQTLNYQGIIGILVNEVKMLKRQLNELQTEWDKSRGLY